MLVLVLFAAGCAAVPKGPGTPDATAVPEPYKGPPRAEAPRPKYNLAGYPPAFRDGYIDGCETARESQFARKDAARFAGDGQYKTGWNDGNSICKPR
jgi:hypothetical protein